MIWFEEYPLEKINKLNENCMVSFCDILITEKTKDSLIGKMEVSDKLKQPFGILHGGANCVLAETLGSLAANLVCDPKLSHAVGLSITTNHIKAVRNGHVTGVATPTHIGRTTHVWDIKTYNDAEQLTSVTSLTMAIVSKLGKK
jgi:1,4-dihydroxy-2-naphthoyl-CoA hydrolase